MYKVLVVDFLYKRLTPHRQEPTLLQFQYALPFFSSSVFLFSSFISIIKYCNSSYNIIFKIYIHISYNGL